MQLLKTWMLRLISFGMLSFLTLVTAVLNPGLLYANKTVIGNYNIYHQSLLPKDFKARLKNIDELVKGSELYDSSLQLDLCLNDGSHYPQIFRTLLPPAFGWGLYNKGIFQGTHDFKKNIVSLNGYEWNLEQLFVHEITHCHQFNKFGFFGSNPMAKHPVWKWEGYAEYVARGLPSQSSLSTNLDRINEQRENDPNEWGVFFEDETVAPRSYYDYWLLMQYCIEIKGMTYEEILNTDLAEDVLTQEINTWYQQSINEINF